MEQWPLTKSIGNTKQRIYTIKFFALFLNVYSRKLF